MIEEERKTAKQVIFDLVSKIKEHIIDLPDNASNNEIRQRIFETCKDDFLHLQEYCKSFAMDFIKYAVRYRAPIPMITCVSEIDREAIWENFCDKRIAKNIKTFDKNINPIFWRQI